MMGVTIFFFVRKVLPELPLLGAALERASLETFMSVTAVNLGVLFLEFMVWHRTLNGLTRLPLGYDLRQSFVILSQTNFAKYLPGKIWSYLWQSALLSRHEISVGTSVGVNALNLLASALGALLTGLCAILFLPLPASQKGLAFFVLILLVLSGLVFGPSIRSFVAKRAGTQVPSGFSLLVLAYVGIWILHGLGSLWLCRDFGVTIDLSLAAQVVGGMAVSWMLGALAIHIPGGLGVRETLLFLALDGLPAGLRVALPVLSRMSLIAAECLALPLSLGLARFKLSKRLSIFATFVILMSGAV